MQNFTIEVRKGTKDGQTVYWVVSHSKTGGYSYRVACAEDRETAEGIAERLRR